MKKILVTAYAVNPYKGSEDGMGWHFIQQIARHQQVIAITRENNQPHIERYMQAHPSPLHERITWLYFDLPYWLRFWKKGSWGAMLYYQMWQRAVVGFIKKQPIQYDIVHNLNFHNNWTPSFLHQLDKPMVWGPVGHHPLIPAQYLKPYPFKYWMKDRFTWVVKQYFWRLSPALRSTVRHSDKILCMNPAAPQVMGLATNHYELIPSVATEDPGNWTPPVHTERFRVISAGRLVPLKGFDLTIRAFAHFYRQLLPVQQSKAELLVVGSGPELDFLRRLAADEGVGAAVRFVEWIDRADLMDLYREASVFLFPSHEGAGMVVAEALSFGLPVVCIDNSGPGAFVDGDCAIAVPQQDYDNTVKDLGAALSRLYTDKEKYLRMRLAARHRFETHFHWDRRGDQLKNIYEKVTI